MTSGIDAAWHILWLPALGLTLQKLASIFLVQNCPHVCTLCLPDIIKHDQSLSLFPCMFEYYKRSKTGGGNGLEMKPLVWHNNVNQSLTPTHQFDTTILPQQLSLSSLIPGQFWSSQSNVFSCSTIDETTASSHAIVDGTTASVHATVEGTTAPFHASIFYPLKLWRWLIC